MTCYSPLNAFKGEVKENGKIEILFKAPAGTERQVLPCGKCIGCKLKYAKDWSLRCVHEASLWERNCFITLTYNDLHLPADGNLDVKVYQNFMKRLRKCHTSQLELVYGDSWKRHFSPIRFYHAAEYGGQLGRPHHHALLFNYDFDDKILYTVRNGNPYYTSEELQNIWPFGFSSISSVNQKSAAYVARYCMKKINGKYSDEHYVNKKTGLLRTPEFTTMSRNPGIGKGWYDKFKGDVYPHDFVVVEGKKERPPRFYDNLLDKQDGDLLESIKVKRMAKVNYEEGTVERLMAKEEVRKSQLKLMVRGEI